MSAMTNPSNPSKNEGEGNKTADREYRKGATEHAQSPRSKEAAKAAEQALEGKEGEQLKEAEKAGKARK